MSTSRTYSYIKHLFQVAETDIGCIKNYSYIGRTLILICIKKDYLLYEDLLSLKAQYESNLPSAYGIERNGEGIRSVRMKRMETVKRRRRKKGGGGGKEDNGY